MGIFDLFKKKDKGVSKEILERREKCAIMGRQYVSDEDYDEWVSCLTDEQKLFITQELQANYHPEDHFWGERFIIRVLYYYNAREGLIMEWDERMKKYQEENKLLTISKALGEDLSEFEWLKDEKVALDELGDDISACTAELRRLYELWPEQFDRIGTIPYINDKK